MNTLKATRILIWISFYEQQTSMGITRGWHGHIALGIWLSLTLTTDSVSWSPATREEHLSTPTNLTLKMNMFVLRWEWEPKPSSVCSIRYSREIKQSHLPKSFRNPFSFQNVDSNKVDLNEWLNFSVTAECHENERKSKSAEMSTFLVAGNSNTAVRNFSCVWYQMEYINCTWSPGEKAPSKVNYTLIYWLKNESSKIELKAPHAMLFKEFLDTAHFCYNYSYVGGIPVGCHFGFRDANEELQLVVTDMSNDNIESFYSSMIPAEKLQLAPPVITNITRFPKDIIHVSWTVSPLEPYQSESELVLKKLDGKLITLTEKYSNNAQITVDDPDAAYSIKVRSKKYYISGSFNWSEWSEEQISPGKSDVWTTNIILAILIPISVTVLTIIAVVCMKRLLLYILPPIPDPRKIFKETFGDPNSLQQFIKYKYVGTNVWDTPQKDEICSVILVETPSSPSHAE